MADLTITITIPHAARADFLDAYAETCGWVDVATSGTKAAFARTQVREQARSTLRTWRRLRAERAALAAIPAAVDDGISAV